jgi:hypothetical protein
MCCWVLNIDSSGRKSAAQKNKEFRKHYGSLPLDLANIWYDMSNTDIPEARISVKEQCDEGFKMFLIAHFYLWMYPKNLSMISSRFNICEWYS